jgi:hypothetical protein
VTAAGQQQGAEQDEQPRDGESRAYAAGVGNQSTEGGERGDCGLLAD